MAFNQVLGFLHWLHHRPRLLGVVLGILGILMVVVGVLGVASTSDDTAKLQALRSSGVTVKGTLVGVDTVTRDGVKGRQDKVSYCPRYAYTAGDGVERTIADRDDCTNSKNDLTGRTVSILVDPADPATAFIDERESSVGRTTFAIFAWSTLVIGASLIVCAPIVFLRSEGKTPKRTSTPPKH